MLLGTHITEHMTQMNRRVEIFNVCAFQVLRYGNRGDSDQVIQSGAVLYVFIKQAVYFQIRHQLHSLVHKTQLSNEISIATCNRRKHGEK